MTLTVFPLDGGSFDNTPHVASSGAAVSPSCMLVICLVATAVVFVGGSEGVLDRVLGLVGWQAWLVSLFFLLWRFSLLLWGVGLCGIRN